MKTRSYYKCQTSIETHVYDGNKLVAHLVYYPAKGYTYPRYHFENWCLLHKEFNYEICRFMRFVEKALANPRMDLDSVYVDSSLESLWQD